MLNCYGRIKITTSYPLDKSDWVSASNKIKRFFLLNKYSNVYNNDWISDECSIYIKEIVTPDVSNFDILDIGITVEFTKEFYKNDMKTTISQFIDILTKRDFVINGNFIVSGHSDKLTYYTINKDGLTEFLFKNII